MDASVDAGKNDAPLTVFFSHAHEDERFVERLARHLSALEAQGIIRRWSRRDIPPGASVETAVQSYLLWAAVFPENQWWLGWFVLVCKVPLFLSLVRPIRDGQIWQAHNNAISPGTHADGQPAHASPSMLLARPEEG